MLEAVIISYGQLAKVTNIYENPASCFEASCEHNLVPNSSVTGCNNYVTNRLVCYMCCFPSVVLFRFVCCQDFGSDFRDTEMVPLLVSKSQQCKKDVTNM